MTAQVETAPAGVLPSPMANGMTGETDSGARKYDALRCAKEVRILIVDDDEPTSRVIEAALQGQEFQITKVNNPADVRAALEQAPAPYHLILLDYVLPGLESEQVFTWVREFQPEASVIVVTGYPSIDSALSCLRARTYDYITKPFQLAHLRQVVVRCLEDKGLLRMSEEALA
jgi:DNA-binding NtrC family response regulator